MQSEIRPFGGSLASYLSPDKSRKLDGETGSNAN